MTEQDTQDAKGPGSIVTTNGIIQLMRLRRECLRCGYVWLPRLETEPRQCPSCKNRLWNEERKKESTNK